MRSLLIEPRVVAGVVFCFVFLAFIGGVTLLRRAAPRGRDFIFATLIAGLVTSNEIIGWQLPPDATGSDPQLRLFRLAGVFLFSSLVFLGIVTLVSRRVPNLFFQIVAIGTGSALASRELAVWKYVGPETGRVLWTVVIALGIALFLFMLLLLRRQPKDWPKSSSD